MALLPPAEGAKMNKFHFSFCVRPSDKTYYYQHVQLEETQDGIEIRCDSPDSECVHLLVPDAFPGFLEAIGAEPGSNVIEAARLAVKRNKRPLVFDELNARSEVKFTWYDWDSPFYGDKGVVVSNEPESDPPKRLFFSMMADYYNMSEEDKECFAREIAAEFFRDPQNGGKHHG
jgi:hypothetical protein